MENIKTPIVKAACGCLILTIARRAKGNKTNLSGFDIKHCPLHKAAPDLLEACKEAQKLFGFIAENYKNAPHFPTAERLVDTAIAKAEKE